MNAAAHSDRAMVDLFQMLKGAQPPCLSLYMPTHRAFPDKEQDPIRYRNLLKKATTALQAHAPQADHDALLAPLQALVDDREFWSQARDGLVVLVAPSVVQIMRVQRAVPERVFVADSFHLKPLLRILQSLDRYQVLCLNRREIKLYEGTRDALDEIELAPGVPRTLTDALGEELTEPQLRVSSHGMGTAGPPSFHGQGARKDEIDVDTERFFRAVDRAVLEHHSRRAGLPLILAALPEQQAVFRALSRNPFLLADGIATSPNALDLDDLRTRAWEVAMSQYEARLEQLAGAFAQGQGKGLASDDLAQIARAAAEGRIGTLLLEAERVVPGRLVDGRIEPAADAAAGVDDVLDDLGERVLDTSGEVIVVPAERMPTRAGAAALFRY